MANRLNNIFDPEALAEAQDYANNIPVPQGLVHTYRPGWDANLVEAEQNPLVFAPAMQESVAKAGDIIGGKGVGLGEMASRLLGVGQERYQTWPEKIVRSGFSLPHDVMTGEVPVRDAEGRTSSELIERTQDLSGLMGGGFTAKPNALVAAAESSHNAPIAALANAPRFYSALEHAVNNSKMPKADADQWLGYLRNQPGVKQEELDWVLHDLPKGQITKAELADFVKGHKIELKEVAKGEINEQRLEELKDIENTRRLTHQEEIEYKQLENNSATKYSQWQLPGGSNYREHLMTLPHTPRDMVRPSDTASAKYMKRWDEINAKIKEIDDTVNAIPRGDQPYKRRNLENERNSLSNERENLHSKMVDDTITESGGRLGGIPFTKVQGSHWDEPNVLAHIRTNERLIPHSDFVRNKPLTNAEFDRIKELDSLIAKNPSNVADLMREGNALWARIEKSKEGVQNGMRSLHIEEIQSDWHQAGRKQGYKGEAEKLKPEFDIAEKKIIDSGDESVMSKPELKDALKEAVDKKIITADEAKTYARYVQIENVAARLPVPDAPFKQSWPDLALKRVIRQAAESGMDSVSWTPGEAQALRYQNEVRQKLNAVEWHNREMGKVAPDGSKKILVTPSSGSEIELTVDKHGLITNGHAQLKGKKLDTVLGKDIATRVMEGDEGSIDAKGYVMNSEPMKAFYDKMLVDKANAIAKKFGGKVEGNQLDNYKVIGQGEGHYAFEHEFNNKADAEEWLKLHPNSGGRLTEVGQPIHVLRITPQLRDAALSKGFALFADTGKVGAPIAALTKVDHNPFELGRLEKQHGVKLTPVAENPFTTDAYHGTPGQWKDNRINPMSGIRINQIGDKFEVKNIVGGWTYKSDFPTKEAAHDWLDKKGLGEFYSAANPKLAEGYSGYDKDLPMMLSSGSNLMPLKLDTSNYHTVDAKGKTWDAVNQFAINEANQLGKKGIIVRNVLDDADSHRSIGPQTVYITLDPSTVRSKFAKFDPAKFHESGLMKASGLPIYSDENGNQLLPTQKGLIKLIPVEGNPFASTASR